jgi:hypothetical protein
MLILVLLMAPVFGLTTGCMVKTEKETVVTQSSPPLMEERPAPPAPVEVWTPGHLECNGRDWTSAPGQWV